MRFLRATRFPLYRQSAILERDTGVSISRATMDGWIMRVGEMLIPVVGAMGRELVAGSYIQADETPVPVQMSDGRGKNHPRLGPVVLEILHCSKLLKA